MRHRSSIDLSGLVVQMVAGFVSLLVIISLAIGLPTMLLVQNQVERQAWARVEQGNRVTHALYDAWLRRTSDIALLTSQRPSLPALLSDRSDGRLSNYLQDLRQGTETDVLLVCDQALGLREAVGEVEPKDLLVFCSLQDETDLMIVTQGPMPTAWLAAAHQIGEKSLGLGQIVAGIKLDDEFVGQMSLQTGLQHTLIIGEQAIASSLPGGASAWKRVAREAVADTTIPPAEEPAHLFFDERPYFSSRLRIAESALIDEAAVEIADIAASARRLMWTLAGSISMVFFAGSLVSTLMARRIGQPLARLVDAAEAIRAGNLDTSLVVPAKVREVNLVSQALESARTELQLTLTELEQSKAWTDELLKALSEGIVSLDEDGRITFFSTGAENITGHTQADALGRLCDELFLPAEDGTPFSQFIPLPGQRAKIHLAPKNGRQMTLAMTSALLGTQGSERVETVIVMRDISQGELVHRLLGQFLANITHEFRTPLSALVASTELLLDQYPDLSHSELQELLSSLHIGLASLQTLIDNLLESASLEAGHFRVYPRATDLGGIFAEAIRMIQPLIEKRRQWLSIEMPADIPQVLADSRRVSQVLVNLLSNASAYSPDDTEVGLNATVAGNSIKVTVSDCGPGIPKGDRPQLFDRFPTKPLEDRHTHHGAGLGLSVVKAIVEAHHGQVGVDDRAGGGSVFWFTLPLAAIV